MKAYTLKIRSGVEIDSAGRKAGKGALIAEDISNTLSASQDQYLFQPVAYGVVTKGNGDAFINPRTHTAIATGGGQAGQGYPCVIQPVGVDRYNQTTTGEKSPTLKTPQGGDDVACVIETIPVTCDEKMGNTYIHEDLANTLAARDYKQPQMVAYGISSYESNAMKSDNPHSGIYEADTSRTLDLNGGNPACNQGGICIVQAYDIGEARLRNPQEYVEKSPTLTARCGTGGNNVPAIVRRLTPLDGVVIALDRASYNQGQNAQYDFSIDDGGVAQTIIAKGPGAVCYKPSEACVQEITRELETNSLKTESDE